MDKLKRKQAMFSVLKTIAYFVGFPLLLVVVLIGLNQFMHYDLFNKSWFLGLVIVAIPWLLACILQIVLGCFVKSQNIKTMVVALVVGIVMVGSALVIDFHGANTIKQAQERYSQDKYVQSGVVVNDYNYQVNWYVTLTDEDSLLDLFKERLEKFVAVYHLEQIGYCWSEDENIDGSKVTLNATEKGLGLTNVAISPNGLLADGWIFSAQNAVDILITYHEILEKATNAGVLLENQEIVVNGIATKVNAYDQIIEKVKNSPEYQEYMLTDEYLEAYGENGTANAHMLTEDKLNAIVPVLTRYLAQALSSVANIGGEITVALVDSILSLDELKSIKTLDQLASFANTTVEKVVSLIDGFIGEGGKNPLKDEFGNSIVPTITSDFIMDLVGELSYYYSPTVRPVFDFIAEATDGDGTKLFDVYDGDELVLSAEEVQRFAYARYYARVHGANVGSVLIGDNLGAVTMTTSGYPSEQFAFTLAELYQMEADLSYIPNLYPLLAARRYLYVFAGICVLSIILFYHFAKREDDMINERIISKGGKK